MAILKDDALVRVSQSANVAQFVSFSPDIPKIRHAVIAGASDLVHPHAAVSQLMQRAAGGIVNVRSFKPGQDRGNPFIMGMDRVDAVIDGVYNLAAQGYYTIVNENIDINDGGVSGVRWNGWTEFAPKDTPRCVEKPGTAGFPAEAADHLFKVIYDVDTPMTDIADGYRVEFSLHPHPVGVRKERSLVWELSDEVADQTIPHRMIDWPNRFSEFLGDKAFGLLVADILGFRVPRTTVVAREVAPFTFGAETHSGYTWTRTSPRRFAAGRYPTEPNYVDIFALLTEWDPQGEAIGSVLVQEGVDAKYSGAVARVDGVHPLVSGVAGIGSEYMLGEVPGSPLPAKVVKEAELLYGRLEELIGPSRFEWVRDSRRMWLVQLNRDLAGDFSISSGSADEWIKFDPREGVDALRELIERIGMREIGVELVRAVGMTSHIGDMLRSAHVPARIVTNEQGSFWS